MTDQAQTPEPSGDDFLLGGGAKSVKFEKIGDSVTGVVLSHEVRDQTKMGSNEIDRWDDGKPKKQLVVILQTSLRDAPVEGVADDGRRALYVKGSRKRGSRSLHDAVATAVREAGGKSLSGGTLTLTYVDNAPAATTGFSDRKLYAGKFVPAGDQAAQSFLSATPLAAEATPAAQAAVTPAPAAPVGAPPNMTPEQAKVWAEYEASKAAKANG